MIFCRLEPAELLRYVDAVGADSNPLVAALADALRGCDDEEVQRLRQEVAQYEQRALDAQEQAWQEALEMARELLSSELDNKIDAAGRQCIDLDDPVEAALDRLNHALERAADIGFDDYLPPKSLGAREVTSARSEPGRSVRSPALSSGSPRELVIEMIPFDRRELRENVIQALRKHGIPDNTAAMAIRRLIDDDKVLKESKGGKYKVLERVKRTP